MGNCYTKKTALCSESCCVNNDEKYFHSKIHKELNRIVLMTVSEGKVENVRNFVEYVSLHKHILDTKKWSKFKEMLKRKLIEFHCNQDSENSRIDCDIYAKRIYGKSIAQLRKTLK